MTLLISTIAGSDLFPQTFAGYARAASATEHGAPAVRFHPAPFDLGPQSVWIQVESHPDLETTLQRARGLSTSFEHTHAFFAQSGWYAITIGVVNRGEADEVLDRLISSGAIPSDSLITRGTRYLVMVWPQEAVAGAGALDAAISREASWSVSMRQSVQDALIWTGDYSGLLDGEFGPRTREAIRSFQHRNGFAVTGYLTGEEIARLDADRNAAISATGFRVVEDTETGIRVGLAEAIFTRVRRDSAVIEYEARPGQPGGRLMLLSTPGTERELRAFFEALLAEGGFGPEPYVARRDGWFVISGTKDGATAYVHARAGDGAIKGFFLSWPAAYGGTFGPIATAMYNSFAALPGIVLDAGRAGADVVGVDTRQSEPEDGSGPETLRTGTGFVVHGSGQILTNAHVVAGCGAVMVDDGTTARVVAVDAALDLALLEAHGRQWPAAAAFAPRPARLNSDVTVLGYPLHGLLGGINVTRGAVSASAGLLNDASHFQITAAVQPGNSGGPVLDGQGAVVGVVQSKLDAVTVANAIGDIPQNVNFAIRGEVALLFLLRHGIGFAFAEPTVPLDPADMAEEAQAWTVLVSCLDR